MRIIKQAAGVSLAVSSCFVLMLSVLDVGFSLRLSRQLMAFGEELFLRITLYSDLSLLTAAGIVLTNIVIYGLLVYPLILLFTFIHYRKSSITQLSEHGLKTQGLGPHSGG
jgi:hypothetical protein